MTADVMITNGLEGRYWSENIVTCEDQETSPRTMLLSKISEVKERLKTKQGNFLFYFAGRNDLNEKIQLRQDDSSTDGNSDNPDNYITHEELKERLGEIKAPYKLFILDTLYSRGIDLLSFSMDEENDSYVLQWSSSKCDEICYNDLTSKMRYFTKAIGDVLSDHECDYDSCMALPQDAVVNITELNTCVRAHMQHLPQTPNLKFSRASGSFYSFPLIAKLI